MRTKIALFSWVFLLLSGGPAIAYEPGLPMHGKIVRTSGPEISVDIQDPTEDRGRYLLVLDESQKKLFLVNGLFVEIRGEIKNRSIDVNSIVPALYDPARGLIQAWSSSK